jgi:pyruvate/2-oxoglutarate dehydrogenase complex dihydrolipoamide dehydrogenase (E3) component
VLFCRYLIDLTTWKSALIIIGGSYIGLEFAQMYRRFGSQVTIVEKGSRLISRDDEDVSEAVKDILENEGINIRLNAECMGAEKDGDRVRVKLDCAKGDKAVIRYHVCETILHCDTTGHAYSSHCVRADTDNARRTKTVALTGQRL